MFRFNIRQEYPGHSAEESFRKVLLGFDDMHKYMPNITEVKVIERRDEDEGREYIAVEIYAEGKFPKIVVPLLGGNRIMWDEYFEVDYNRRIAEWRVEPPVFAEYVHCSGVSMIKEMDCGSVLVSEGTLDIEIVKLRGISVEVLRPAVAALEKFIGRMVSANLKKYFREVKKMLDSEEN